MTTVNASGPRPCNVMIVGMAPAREEVATGIPFMGASGRILNNALRRLGVDRKHVFVTNISDTPIDKSLYDLSGDVLARQLERLKREIAEVRPNVIIPLGEEPLFYLTGKHSITKWRGSILPCTLVPGRKCVPSVHPAWIVRGMWKWLAVFTHIDLKRGLEQGKFPELRPPKREALTGPSFNSVIDYLTHMNSQEFCSFDIETMWWKKSAMGEIACVAFSYRADQALCVPFIRGNGQNYWTEAEEVVIWRAIATVLQNPNVKKIAQNASFEWIYFCKHRIFPWPMYIDTMTLHHCLYPDFGSVESLFRRKDLTNPGHGLAFINSQYTESPYYKDDGRWWSPELGDHQFWVYNSMDAMVTLECAMKELDEAREERLWDFYQTQYVRAFKHALRMEWFGTPIDVELREVAGKELALREIELQKEINMTVGYNLNVNSPKQMHQLLYEQKGYQVKKNVRTKKATADKNVLAYFANKNSDLVLTKILELRQVRDTISDVIRQPLDENNHIHTHFNLGGTDGLRWSSSKSILGSGTNIQNLPRDGIARRLFSANPARSETIKSVRDEFEVDLSAWESALRIERPN